MSAEYFNSLGGFSAGIPEVPVVDANGIIISNFTEQTVQPVQPVQPQPILRVNPIQPPEVDFSAQPKHIVRRIMMHV